MVSPQPGDYIDVHTHEASLLPGIFPVENLMAHEEKTPYDITGLVCTMGIHPWFLNEDNHLQLINAVEKAAGHPYLIAIGEAGFDKLRGPSPELQRTAFEEQVAIAEKYGKPVIIHCVRAWDELMAEHKKLKPSLPWLVHGFRGKKELAIQLISRGMYISFWFDFVVRNGSSELVRSLPRDRIFFETDGADVDIRDIYNKVAGDLHLRVDELKAIILANYKDIFRV